VTDRIYLRPSECAVLIGVSSDYIVGEIKDGRLPARVNLSPKGRTRYRVWVEDWQAYVVRYWPMKIAS
jgi:predicted DNA-binding transcriptional regulator AlpA